MEKKESQWEKDTEKIVIKEQKEEIIETDVKTDYALIKEQHEQAKLRFIQNNMEYKNAHANKNIFNKKNIEKEYIFKSIFNKEDVEKNTNLKVFSSRRA